MPFILENEPKRERFYLSIGMNEIYDFIFQKRVDENGLELWIEWNEKLDKLIPWINGYGYHAFGDEGLMNLDCLEEALVQKVSGLKVQYGIEYNGEQIEGFSIEDACCLEMDDNGKHLLYLDKSFDKRNNEHISFLSNLLITLINPDIDVKRVEWIMLMNQYFRHGEISGINPYYSKKIEETSEDIKIEETAEETEDETEEYKVEEEDKEIPFGEDPSIEESMEREKEAVEEEEIEGEEDKRKTDEEKKKELDDGLNQPKKPVKQKKEKKEKKYPAPRYRGGSYPTPHAINYEEERNWVRSQANNFCQVCILFCETCPVKNVEAQCPCEIRKNAEKALHHHHLEGLEGKSTRDVKGNLAVLCPYHHKQLDGVNLRVGYMNNKVIVEERKDDFVLTVYPRDKDEGEIKIRFSKEHFDEFRNYVEKRSLK